MSIKEEEEINQDFNQDAAKEIILDLISLVVDSFHEQRDELNSNSASISSPISP